MLFKRKPKPPLEQAMWMLDDAVEIMYQYKRDKGYKPTASDMELFERITQRFWECHTTASYITSLLQQRMTGELEGAKKFNDAEAFDYHYPHNG